MNFISNCHDHKGRCEKLNGGMNRVRNQNVYLLKFCYSRSISTFSLDFYARRMVRMGKVIKFLSGDV